MDRTTVLFDANFANRVEELTPRDREALLSFLDQIDLRASIEVIEEVLAVAGTKKADRLPGRARLLLIATRFAPFRSYPDVVQAELRGGVSALIDAADHGRIRAALQDLAGGRPPSESLKLLTSHLTREKDSVEPGYRKHQFPLRDLARGRPSPARALPYERVHREYWRKQSACMDRLLGLEKSSPSFAEALQRPAEFPFTRALARVHTALLYRYLVEDRRVDRGDVQDGAILVHLAGADALVTDDNGIRELAAHVWGNERSVKSFGEFRDWLRRRP